MDMNCNDALPLVGAYLDGELSEARATLLRKHLLECHACRNSAQEGKTLKRWFAPLRAAAEEPGSEFSVRVPSGFAARVARRAFAGDTGERAFTLPRPRETNVLSFALYATAIAAALTLFLAIALRMQTRPSGGNVHATEGSYEQVIEELDQLNRTAPTTPTSKAGESAPASQVRPAAR